MSELGPTAQGLFAAARDGDDPTDADRERVEKALFAAIAAGMTSVATATAATTTAGSAGSSGASAGAGAGSVGTAATVATTGGMGVLKIVVALALLGGGGTGALWAGGAFDAPAASPSSSSSVTPSPAAARETSPEESMAIEPAPAAEVSDGPELEPPAPPPPAEAASVVGPEMRRRAPPASRPSAAGIATEATEPTDVDPLTEELGLLRDANRALRRGRPGEALSLLEEHGRRFPEGSMATEREAARAVALCDAGRRAEGQRAAEAFVERYPGSPLVTRVREACEAR